MPTSLTPEKLGALIHLRKLFVEARETVRANPDGSLTLYGPAARYCEALSACAPALLDLAERVCPECGGRGELIYGLPDPERVRCDACAGTGTGWRAAARSFFEGIRCTHETPSPPARAATPPGRHSSGAPEATKLRSHEGYEGSESMTDDLAPAQLDALDLAARRASAPGGPTSIRRRFDEELNALCNPDTIRVLVRAARRAAELEIMHKAWTDFFGTTQLTHAAARLEAFERRAAELAAGTELDEKEPHAN